MDMSDMSWVFNEYLMCTTNYSQNQCRIKPLHSSCFALLECCSKLPPAHMNHGILHMASVWFLPSLPDHHRQPQHLIHPNRHGGTSAFTRMPLGCFSALALSDDPPSTYCPARVLRLAAEEEPHSAPHTNRHQWLTTLIDILWDLMGFIGYSNEPYSEFMSELT